MQPGEEVQFDHMTNEQATAFGNFESQWTRVAEYFEDQLVMIHNAGSAWLILSEAGFTKNAIKPWRKAMWCIPPKQDAAFVCAMERVLDVYKRPLDPDYPVVCMDETSTQCVQEVRPVIAAKPGRIERYDVEYQRNGVAHLIQFYAPFAGWRRIQVADNHAACEWAKGVRTLVEQDFADAERITLVMDNLNTHTGASLYKAFEPHIARALLDKLEFVYTPKHGSWLNMAECEFSVLSRQCLSRRLPDLEIVRQEVNAWSLARNQAAATTEWRCTTEDARMKLKQLYSVISN